MASSLIYNGKIDSSNLESFVNDCFLTVSIDAEQKNEHGEWVSFWQYRNVGCPMIHGQAHGPKKKRSEGVSREELSEAIRRLPKGMRATYYDNYRGIRGTIEL